MSTQMKRGRSDADDWFPVSISTSRAFTVQLLREHECYLKERFSKANPKLREELTRIVKTRRQQGVELARKDNNQEDLAISLQRMSLEDLSTYISSEIEDLSNSQAKLEEKRSKGAHKISPKTRKFVSEFDRFVNAYSGIVDIVRLVDAQYGGVAGATLTLLFSTVKMKVKGEESITAAMQQMSDRLPDLGIYQKIYPEPELGLMLVDAYKDVILLARAATSYFMDSTWGRQITTFGKPLQFELMEQSMRDKFSRIRLRCETLLAQRVDLLVCEVQDLHKRMDNDTVLKTRDMLMLGKYHTDDAIIALKQYREILASIFDKDRHRTKLRVADFLAHEAGCCWQESASRLFMISGCNEKGVGSPQSWLSPMAVDLTLELLGTNRMVVFEVCDESSTLETVLSRLTFQLLEKNPAVVRNTDEWYKIQSLISRLGTEREDALNEVLLKAIELQKEPVFIVLDRPERSEEQSVADYASAMLGLVEQRQTSVKVLMVYRAELWDWDANKRGILRNGKSAEVCHAIGFDQHRL